MAKHANNTTQPAPAIPTIADLGRYLASLARTAGEIGDAGADAHDPRPNLLFQQQEGVERTIAARPAASLEDAAVQIGVACDRLRNLHELAWHQPEKLATLAEWHESALRLLLSALPFIASAAGLDMGRMGWGALDELRAETFGSGSAPLGLRAQH